MASNRQWAAGNSPPSPYDVKRSTIRCLRCNKKKRSVYASLPCSCGGTLVYIQYPMRKAAEALHQAGFEIRGASFLRGDDIYSFDDIRIYCTTIAYIDFFKVYDFDKILEIYPFGEVASKELKNLQGGEVKSIAGKSGESACTQDEIDAIFNSLPGEVIQQPPIWEAVDAKEIDLHFTRLFHASVDFYKQEGITEIGGAAAEAIALLERWARSLKNGIDSVLFLAGLL